MSSDSCCWTAFSSAPSPVSRASRPDTSPGIVSDPSAHYREDEVAHLLMDMSGAARAANALQDCSRWDESETTEEAEEEMKGGGMIDDDTKDEEEEEKPKRDTRRLTFCRDSHTYRHPLLGKDFLSTLPTKAIIKNAVPKSAAQHLDREDECPNCGTWIKADIVSYGNGWAIVVPIDREATIDRPSDDEDCRKEARVGRVDNKDAKDKSETEPAPVPELAPTPDVIPEDTIRVTCTRTSKAFDDWRAFQVDIGINDAYNTRIDSRGNISHKNKGEESYRAKLAASKRKAAANGASRLSKVPVAKTVINFETRGAAPAFSRSPAIFFKQGQVVAPPKAASRKHKAPIPEMAASATRTEEAPAITMPASKKRKSCDPEAATPSYKRVEIPAITVPISKKRMVSAPETATPSTQTDKAPANSTQTSKKRKASAPPAAKIEQVLGSPTPATKKRKMRSTPVKKDRFVGQKEEKKDPIVGQKEEAANPIVRPRREPKKPKKLMD